MNGERNGKLPVGGRIKVVARVDLEAAKIDFVLADVSGTPATKATKKTRQGRSR
jgi:hypothetical protein